MIFEILSSAVILYFCYKLVIYRRRKTRKFAEKMREKFRSKQ
jgi:hypothetical protein